MTMPRHEPYEELISASLTGDLSLAERQRLEAHLAGCAPCRDTMAAFAEGRRIAAGLRHVPPPRDLGARVRTGIERGAFAPTPWWRRPAAIFAGVGGSLAAVAGALLAITIMGGDADDRPVGGLDSPTPSLSASATMSESADPTPATAAPITSPPPSATPVPQVTLPPVVTDPTPAPTGGATPAPTPTPPPSASPTASPAPQPDVFLAFTGDFDNLALTLQEPQPEDPSPAPIATIEDTPTGPPIAAELSPDGEWLAYVTEVGQSGFNEVRVTRVGLRPDPDADQVESPLEVGETVVLGESIAANPFLQVLAWSQDSRRLAYTLADPESDGATDAWLFDAALGTPVRLTDSGNGFAASWLPPAEDDERVTRLWVSFADEEPTSHLVELPVVEPETPQPSESPEPATPVSDVIREEPDVFLPLLSAHGHLAIYWTGTMEAGGDGTWAFVEGGEPYLAEHDLRDERYEFGNERPLFSDLDEETDLFSSAAIRWGPDGDAYAVWDTRWTGENEGDDELVYPDPGRVYFGHATDPRGLTRFHAIDRDDLPEDGSVVDVKLSPTGHHLVITVRRPIDGDLSAPRADLLLVTRNTGDVADEVQPLGWTDQGWFGPAAFDAYVEVDGED